LDCKNILIIDDEPFIRDIFSHFLSVENGFNVQTAGTNDEATKYLDMDAFDLILADVHMPGMTFSDFLVHVLSHSIHKRCPIVAVTGVPDRINEQDRLKIQGVIEKPFIPSELLEMVHSLV
jgi:CheY-like chemotaxis protein